MKILGTTVKHENRKFKLAAHALQTAAGRRIEKEFLLHPGSVLLLAMPAPDRVILLQNYRHTIDRTLWELPAGTVEWGEDPTATAHRELIEETGFAAGKLEPLFDFYPSPGLIAEKMKVYLATDLSPRAMALEEEEEIVPVEVAWDEALAMAADGRIVDGKTLVALWYWDRHPRGPKPAAADATAGGSPGVHSS